VLGRKTTGSVVCPSCGLLVGVNDPRCYNCGRANPGLWGFAPVLRQLGRDFGFIPVVMGICGIVFLLTLISSGGAMRGGIDFLSPSRYALLRFGASGALPVFGLGAWWTVLSAIWLHGGILHIVLNMLAFRSLASATIELIGPARTAIIYVVSGACGFLLTSVAGYFGGLPLLGGASTTVGASGAILGLAGALLHYGRVSGSRYIRAQMTQYLISMVVIGLLFPYVDNLAHLGGFAGGYATSAVLNPLTRERGDHMLIAVVCLAATLAAVAASLITMPALR
jgi:rhomboid protease GluP